MNYKIFSDFEANGNSIENTIDKLPMEVKTLQKKYGEGVFMNGFLKLINSEDYIEITIDSYLDAKKAVPFLISAFGDIFVYKDKGYIALLNYKSMHCKVIGKGIEQFWDDLMNPRYQKDCGMDVALYTEAIQKHGKLHFEECFSFTPLLALGGKKDMKHIGIENVKEYISRIVDIVGRIE